MISQHVVVLSTLLSASWCADLTFPPGFKFGAATASYQVEGAWNVSDKGENIWDRFTHNTPEAIHNRSNGDVACDSYHNYKEDVQLAKNLGLHFYRLSIAWSRLLPTGFANYISKDGAEYYSNLLDELVRNGIEPVVTLYHWDLPQSLQDLGGWANPLIIEWFSDYARVVYTLYADRVKTWITINEAIAVCESASIGQVAPGTKDRDNFPYMCNKYVMLAHAAAYRIYDEEFKPQHNGKRIKESFLFLDKRNPMPVLFVDISGEGKVSKSNHIIWFMPASDDPRDIELAELSNEFSVGRFSHPIYSEEGGWPPTVESFMEEKSKKEGYFKSRLPAFTKEEIEFIRGTYDFFGLNHYTSRIVRTMEPGEEDAVWPVIGSPELGTMWDTRPEWEESTATSWFYVYPEGLRASLKWITQHYGNLSILITENGYPTSDPGLEDYSRINYYTEHLKQVLLSIKEDGVNVEGYTAWTLIDNFEWGDGYLTKFGLHHVDFNDPERKRTLRLSAQFYKQVIEKHSLDF